MQNENTYKRKGSEPVEQHTTAAWAGIQAQKPVSKVPKPSLNGVYNAKEYVDANEK